MFGKELCEWMCQKNFPSGKHALMWNAFKRKLPLLKLIIHDMKKFLPSQKRDDSRRVDYQIRVKFKEDYPISTLIYEEDYVKYGVHNCIKQTL